MGSAGSSSLGELIFFSGIGSSSESVDEIDDGESFPRISFGEPPGGSFGSSLNPCLILGRAALFHQALPLA